ncbi:ATPase family AAA domain-containing protein 1-A [Dichanthelium oligosanthes]|uniref:ATPase family AAA domain-containing protein 1-A n=1 Tax=Dichanthelium oligosanthes TaxID=888268 RepID=A0A1E5VM53_9POAL|nr:ATPase family AAA domain-containing protein 1-A [Dichanthelium oligosanthes]
MVDTRRSAAAAANPGGGGGSDGGGGGGGKVGRDGRKRAAAPSSAPPQTKRSKVKVEVEAEASASPPNKSSGPTATGAWAKMLSQNPQTPHVLMTPSEIFVGRGSEMYQETLTKALAKHFEARLLILDSLMLCGTSSKFQESLTDIRSDDAPTSSSGADIAGTSNKNTFREGDRVEYIGVGSLNSMSSAYGFRGKVVLAFEKNGSSKVGVRFDNPIDNGSDLGGLSVELQPDSSGGEEVDSVALCKLIEVISEESKNSSLIVLLKDVEKSFTEYTESHASLRSELPASVLIIGSHTQGESCKDQPAIGSATEKMKYLNDLFPNKITIELPQFLISREIECNDLEELSINDQLLTIENVDKIVGYAVSHHLRQIKLRKAGKMVLPIESLKHGFSVVQSTHRGNKSSKNALKDVITENAFEEKILSNVISPNDSGVTFEDIGALDNVKKTLKELVMLPLQRPELFTQGQLRKPVKGILLFGPPGTGKTMLAKAVATEAGANFINVSISSITSKFFGEAEKYVDAIFSLSSKLSPAVIFVDEVDSLLGNREGSGENETMCKMKNEFMINWDGLRTKEQEHVIVLGATNRPYDLDDAVIRRFPRRLMVGLPDASNREKILKVILSKEILAPDVNLKFVANMAHGYSGSDLKNLCVTAAFGPVRGIIEKEEKEKSLPERPLYGSKDIGPIRMDDFKFALRQVCASFSPASRAMDALVEWNNEFGEGGSRKKDELSYIM